MIEGQEGRRKRSVREGAHRNRDEPRLNVDAVVDGGPAIGTEAVGDAAALVTDPRELRRSAGSDPRIAPCMTLQLWPAPPGSREDHKQPTALQLTGPVARRHPTSSKAGPPSNWSSRGGFGRPPETGDPS